jgi:hypothetical protein
VAFLTIFFAYGLSNAHVCMTSTLLPPPRPCKKKMTVIMTVLIICSSTTRHLMPSRNRSLRLGFLSLLNRFLGLRANIFNISKPAMHERGDIPRNQTHIWSSPSYEHSGANQLRSGQTAIASRAFEPLAHSTQQLKARPARTPPLVDVDEAEPSARQPQSRFVSAQKLPYSPLCSTVWSDVC